MLGTRSFTNCRETATVVGGVVQVRHAASDVVKETEALSLRTQSANTKRLTERLHDINYWKAELRREIGDIISETDLLVQQKLRLENALRATEIPLHIATDNLHCRQRRQNIDLVQDVVEIVLLKVCAAGQKLSYDCPTIMPKLRSTYDRRLIYKTCYEARKSVFGTIHSQNCKIV